jgi:hypothetical protein
MLALSTGGGGAGASSFFLQPATAAANTTTMTRNHENLRVTIFRMMDSSFSK